MLPLYIQSLTPQHQESNSISDFCLSKHCPFFTPWVICGDWLHSTLTTPARLNFNFVLVPKAIIWHFSLYQANLQHLGQVTKEVNDNYANWEKNSDPAFEGLVTDLNQRTKE